MPFYKCYACMKLFFSEGRRGTCKFCNTILDEDIHRQPSPPPRLTRRHSFSGTGALTPEQQLRAYEVQQHAIKKTPACPSCLALETASMGKPDEALGYSPDCNLYACGSCGSMLVWDPKLQFDPRYAHRSVSDRMTRLNCIGYRSLNLPGTVAAQTILVRGFDFREGGDNIGYRSGMTDAIVLYENAELPKAGDIMPDTAHCFSRLIRGATIFPNDTAITHCFLFVCYLREGFDTHAQQVSEVGAILQHYPPLAARRQQVAWPLAANEVATERLAPRDILAYVQYTRTWASANWREGGAYAIDIATLQFRVGLSLTVRTAIRDLLTQYANGPIPQTPR